MLISSQNGLKLEKAFNCDAFKIPLADESIDLVFTAGVLIHIHPNDLLKAMSEIVRVSKRYVLCMEYFSHQPEEILYRGQKGLLFKRDFGSFYLDNFPQLKCLNYGFLWKKEFPIFDDMTWWLFEKIQL
jgi:ubiquinone/menaquinone biosynthesis C-methylase UbiE